MIKVAVLGFGNMGRMLASKIAAGKAELHLANRSAEKLEGFISANRVVNHGDDFRAASADADFVFLCVKPQSCHEILASVADALPRDAHLVSIASDVSIANLEKRFGGKVTRMVPTVTMEVDRGVTLLAANGKVGKGDIAVLTSLFGSSASFRPIVEEDLEAMSIVTSCGPGILAVLFEEFLEALVRRGVMAGAGDGDAAETCLLQTAAGLTELARIGSAGLDSIYGRVATKGGTTEIGASAIREGGPAIFDAMIERMMARHAERRQLIDGLFAL